MAHEQGDGQHRVTKRTPDGPGNVTRCGCCGSWLGTENPAPPIEDDEGVPELIGAGSVFGSGAFAHGGRAGDNAVTAYAVQIHPVKRVRDAIGAYCATCRIAWSVTDSVPWSFTNSKAMHEQGTGHKVILYAFAEGN